MKFQRQGRSCLVLFSFSFQQTVLKQKKHMSRLPIILPNCHGNLPTSWHNSHGGKWSKTFYITLGSRKPWRQMERGGLVSSGLLCGGSPPWDQLTRLVACLDLSSSSWHNKILLSCPCHIPCSRAQRSAELPELLVLNVSPTAGLVSVGLVSTLCRDPGAVVPMPTWLLMVRGTFCGSQFLQWEGCPEFPHYKEWANLCCIPASWLWRGFLEKWTAVMWWSYPFPHPGHHSQNTLAVWALVCATSQTTSEERVLQGGKSLSLGDCLLGQAQLVLQGQYFFCPVIWL